jgi:hypothetical protein
MPKEFRSSNDKKSKPALAYSDFVIRVCFVIRHSDFVIASAESKTGDTRSPSISR